MFVLATAIPHAPVNEDPMRCREAQCIKTNCRDSISTQFSYGTFNDRDRPFAHMDKASSCMASLTFRKAPIIDILRTIHSTIPSTTEQPAWS